MKLSLTHYSIIVYKNSWHGQHYVGYLTVKQVKTAKKIIILPKFNCKNVINKCEIIENNIKIKIYEPVWCRLYTEVRRVTEINEASRKGP